MIGLRRVYGTVVFSRQCGRRQCCLSSTTAAKGTPPLRRRQPLPPMPRVLPPPVVSSSTYGAAEAIPSSSSPPKQRGGRVLIGTGWFLLGLLAVDQVLQYMDRRQAQSTVAELHQAEVAARHSFYQAHVDSPVLDECIVKFEYKMSGTRGLQGVRLHDRLEVVEQGVGPNASYATCRKRNDKGEITSIGWYPLSFMEKLDKEGRQHTRKKFLGLF